MWLEDFFDYKNKLMEDLCSSDEVVKLIRDSETVDVPDKNLIYSHIYPYEFIPETVDHGNTYICFDVDIARVENKTFYVPVVYIWIFTHKSKLRCGKEFGGGLRLDKMASEIDKILNGSREYGLGELALTSVTRFSPILDYQGRVLVYTARDFNRQGVKETPKNRKGV